MKKNILGIVLLSFLAFEAISIATQPAAASAPAAEVLQGTPTPTPTPGQGPSDPDGDPIPPDLLPQQPPAL